MFYFLFLLNCSNQKPCLFFLFLHEIIFSGYLFEWLTHSKHTHAESRKMCLLSIAVLRTLPFVGEKKCQFLFSPGKPNFRHLFNSLRASLTTADGILKQLCIVSFLRGSKFCKSHEVSSPTIISEKNIECCLLQIYQHQYTFGPADFDKPMYPCSLIRLFTVCLWKPWIVSYLQGACTVCIG